MKLSLITVSVLLILSVAVMSSAHAVINSSEDTVEIYETVLYGEKSAAEGFRVKLNTTCGNRLFWDTFYTFGEEPITETEFYFTPNRTNRHTTQEPFYEGVRIWINSNMGISSSGTIDLNEETGRFGKVFLDVASRTSNGTSNTEIVRLADYYEYYPLTVNIHIPYMKYRWEDGEKFVEQYLSNDSNVINEAIADIFTIPVGEETYRVTVDKNKTGGITGVNINQESGKTIGLWNVGVATDNACLFSIQGSYGYDGEIDYSKIKDGPGLYCLPFTPSDDDPNCVLMNPYSIKNVYPLSEDEVISTIWESKDGKNVSMIILQNDKYRLTVLDSETYEELQQIDLFGEGTNLSLMETFKYDDFIVSFTGSNEFSVFSIDENGLYIPELNGNADIFGSHGINGFNVQYNSEMYFDGKRLAIISQYYDSEYGLAEYSPCQCGFVMSVFSSDGLLYTGLYENSLDLSQGRDISMRCQLDSLPFEIGPANSEKNR